ncbi:helix-turn-helix transcriptional regulator [Staphylococcus kloosii]|uniref:Transcriptional regulator n=1 Tax=Staphylococcus kloosii TaxID=29384 RepID=A0A151A232_9STAP|nr:HTH domain-containing protein [Staphylococcus kloosii]AVQ35454.1 HTH domain-containing protein [Staphylococcus kloosii]KYH13305.1 DNA-binding transcriptional regulator [Staphylococcus kloosii]MBF7021393.1 HTH domain-containing protein [Staphylococcus kloosii]MBF7024744.1 HTH domain-containing protein [Staphylococcus kloosii]MBF7030670.1 HTH domain-containing protein [Staphylococcus kloosii]
MNKRERQNMIVNAIHHNKQITAAELANNLKVSKRTILRDIQDLEDQGVKILAKHGKLGGYQLQESQHNYAIELTESQLSALFLVLNESQSISTLPYKEEISAIIKKCLNLPYSKMRKTLKRLDRYIKFEQHEHVALPSLFSDLLIYCTERNVMSMEYFDEEQLFTENVIFIGLICENGLWKAVVFEIGLGSTSEIPIANIQDIAYSFEKKIKTQDISIKNYREFLNPTEV